MSVTDVPVKAFWVEPLDLTRISLRRYRSRSDHPDEPECPREGSWGYHDVTNIIGTAKIHRVTEEDGYVHWGRPEFVYPDHDDPRWPRACPCGYQFQEDDEWQEDSRPLYGRQENGIPLSIRDDIPGMMYDAWWLPFGWAGPDGLHLCVVCPGGHLWHIDGRASNCTLPEDNEHRCWVRHGTPPDLTVDKNGLTCSAGAGSIMAGDYHGFLQGGFFTPG